MRKILIIGLIALIAPLYANGLAGTYAVDGKNPNGSKYTGTAVISGDESTGYTVNWDVAGSQYTGTGTISGDTLTVDWGQPDPVVYKVQADGSLKGRWGPGGKGKEKLTRQ